MVLATSSDESQLGRLRRGIGADHAIDLVTNASDVERSKPAPDLIQAALGAASLRPEDAVMVGDTRWDVESARRQGCRA